MRKDFYIFRHGETECNRQGRWQGCGVDYNLNETGVKQAGILAEKIKEYGLEIICSSPLKRAKQTAEIVGSRLGIGIKTLPELTEACLGICEGMLKTDIEAEYPDIWQQWYSPEMDMDVRWPEGESKLEIQQRMFKAFEKMLKLPENVIGVASHSGAMRYFFLAFGYGPHKMPNTALFHLVWQDGNWHLEELSVK